MHCVPNIILVSIHTPNFLSFCHHQGFLTWAGFPIVGLAHPVVALAEWTVVFARLSHLADADPTLTPSSVIAQLPPWDAAPELRLSPGQPAESRNTQTAPVEDSKQDKLWSKPGAAAQSRWELGSWETTLLSLTSANTQNIALTTSSAMKNYFLPQITCFSSFPSEISLLPVRMLILYSTYLFNHIGLIYFLIRHIWYICTNTYSLIIFYEAFWS